MTCKGRERDPTANTTREENKNCIPVLFFFWPSSRSSKLSLLLSLCSHESRLLKVARHLCVCVFILRYRTCTLLVRASLAPMRKHSSKLLATGAQSIWGEVSFWLFVCADIFVYVCRSKGLTRTKLINDGLLPSIDKTHSPEKNDHFRQLITSFKGHWLTMTNPN